MGHGNAIVVLFALAAGVAARESETLAVNPIRRVVSMLQMMQKKIQAEGEKEKELFEKFQCYCKSGGGTLEGSIGDAKTKIPQLESDLDAAGAEKKQLAQDVAAHTSDRDAAKAAIKEATGIREADAKAFAAMKADADANIDAMAKAIAAISKGMSGSFLQTSAASVLRRLSQSGHMDESDRETLTAFLSEGQGYSPQSGQIVGILKQMQDTWNSDLDDAIKTEEKAKTDFAALMAAKTKLVNALQKSIEEKTKRLGEVGVELVNIAEDLDDTKKSLAEDEKFLADLDTSCKTKAAEFDERSKTRTQELLALADTIKILNDDDALELFKKTLPTPALLQVRVSTREVVARAQQVLKGQVHDSRLDLISLALHGRKINFDKVIKMIDDMVALLGREQVDDGSKKAYCEKEFDESEDEQKALERSLKLLGTAIEKNKGAIATLTEEIAALTKAIKDTDTAVAEATAQRKAEHEDYKSDLSANTAAKEIIKLAKNRMNKFYNPKLYKAPPKEELSAEGRIATNLGGASFVQISAHSADETKDAPAPPPETWDAYQNKGEESSGVVAMMDLLSADLAKEMQENEVDEKNAQEEYEQLVADSAEKRAADSKLLSEKEGTKADTEAALEKNTGDKKSATKEAYANDKYIHNLHGECDWLIMNFDTRKAARAGEIESLKNAKAVLSGADYAFVQTKQTLLRAGRA